MKLPRRRFLQLTGAALAAPALMRVARAETWPARPVHMIVGQASGSSSDNTARLIGQLLTERLGQQFVVEDRPGAGGNIATEFVMHAPADGYTMLLVNAQNTINAALYDKTDFLRRQVLTARNVRGGRLTDFALGGLNYQIEHHLFPTCPLAKLKQITPTSWRSARRRIWRTRGRASSSRTGSSSASSTPSRARAHSHRLDHGDGPARTAWLRRPRRPYLAHGGKRRRAEGSALPPGLW